jgi:hypothetical protein
VLGDNLPLESGSSFSVSFVSLMGLGGGPDLRHGLCPESLMGLGKALDGGHPWSLVGFTVVPSGGQEQGRGVTGGTPTAWTQKED